MTDDTTGDTTVPNAQGTMTAMVSTKRGPTMRATSTTGATGAKGDKGDQGIQGLKGDQGEPGTPGAKGDTGAKGDQGIQGVSGVYPAKRVFQCNSHNHPECGARNDPGHPDPNLLYPRKRCYQHYGARGRKQHQHRAGVEYRRRRFRVQRRWHNRSPGCVGRVRSKGMTKPKYVVQQLWNEQAPGTVLTETQLRKLDANADIDQLVANGLLVLGSPDAASTPDSSDSTPPEDAAAAAASEPAAGKRKAEPQPTTVTNKKNGTITATVE